MKGWNGTTESIDGARDSVLHLFSRTQFADQRLFAAKELFKADCTLHAERNLNEADAVLKGLLRSLRAARKNIKEARSSMRA